MESLTRDVASLGVSLVYCGVVVSAGEIIRKRRGYGGEFTRKLVHISIGLWIIPTLFLFTKWYWAAALPALAIVSNTLSMKFNLLRGIERPDKNDFGTIFFPASFVICLWAFFHTDFPVAAAAGIISMALGDAAAAIYGKARGKHPYTFLGAKKSYEGSAAMLIVSLAALFLTLLLFGVPLGSAVIVSLVIAPVATLLEAAGKNGLDNLTVPVACSFLTWLLLTVMEGHA